MLMYDSYELCITFYFEPSTGVNFLENKTSFQHSLSNKIFFQKIKIKRPTMLFTELHDFRILDCKVTTGRLVLSASNSR